MLRTALREEIAHALATRLRRVRPDVVFDDSHPHRVRDARDNLAVGVPWSDVRDDLLRAEDAGSFGRDPLDEVRDVDSPMALAVNTFGRFRVSPESLSLPGLSRFDVLRFGKRLRTGLGGPPARLDALALGYDAILGIGCALTGPLATKTVTLAASCAGEVRSAASPEWAELYASLSSDQKRFRFLDAAGLVRQYLGMRSALGDEPQPKTLLYVFWEPVNWADVPAFSAHRREILEFSLAVAGSDVSFVSMSCAELWSLFEDGPDRDDRADWLAYLRERYAFGI